MRNAIISREREEIFNKIELVVNVGGTCDIKVRNHDL
jgi:hypothetical protein